MHILLADAMINQLFCTTAYQIPLTFLDAHFQLDLTNTNIRNFLSHLLLFIIITTNLCYTVYEIIEKVFGVFVLLLDIYCFYFQLLKQLFTACFLQVQRFVSFTN